MSDCLSIYCFASVLTCTSRFIIPYLRVGYNNLYKNSTLFIGTIPIKKKQPDRKNFEKRNFYQLCPLKKFPVVRQ